MIEKNKLLFGIIFIILGLVLLVFNFKNKDYDKNRAWDFAMIYKGLVGSLAFIAIGLVLIMIHYGFF